MLLSSWCWASVKVMLSSFCVAILVGEDNHEVLAGEVLLQLVGQALQCVLVGDGALTGGDDDKQMVVGDVGGQLGQLVPGAMSIIWRFRPL